MDLDGAAIERARRRLAELGVEATPADDPTAWIETAADHVLDAGADLTFDHLVARAGVDAAELERLFEDLGVEVASRDRAMFDDADLALVRTFTGARGRWVDADEVAEVMRVLGRAMATAAGASVSYHVRSVESDIDDLADWIEANHEMAGLARSLGDHLGALFRHHLRQSIDLQRLANIGTGQGELLELAVAFVDLTGFTAVGATRGLDGLAAVVGRLEELASTAARAHGTRVVKLMGDEAMLVGADGAQVVAAAWQLVDAVAAEGIPAHGAATTGTVMIMHGDYFGPSINLAARLVNEAASGELLTDASLAAVEGLETTPAGRPDLAGIGPVDVYRLVR